MNYSNYSQTIAKAIRNFLIKDDIDYIFIKDNGTFHFRMTMEGHIKYINCQIIVSSDGYVVYSSFPIGPNSSDKTAIMETKDFLCRANYDMIVGSFQIDSDSLEIRFKNYIAANDIKPTTTMIERSIYHPVTVFMKYGPGIMEVALGKSNARDAIDSCEKLSISELLSALKEYLNEKTETTGLPDHDVG